MLKAYSRETIEAALQLAVLELWRADRGHAREMHCEKLNRGDILRHFVNRAVSAVIAMDKKEA